jgi:hypothetical protein
MSATPSIADLLNRDRDMANRDVDFSTWGDDGLLEKLSVYRAMLQSERDERVRVFIGLQLEAVVAEMDRRNLERTDRKLGVGGGR